MPWVGVNDFGILNWLPEMPLWLYVTLGVLLMDFVGAYLPHYTEHKVPPLWMVHLVHHSDHKVDTTTAKCHAIASPSRSSSLANQTISCLIDEFFQSPCELL